MSGPDAFDLPDDNGPTIDREHERHSDLALMDSEEYKNKRRLEKLLDAHDLVEEVDNTSMVKLAYDEIDHYARRLLLFRAVKQFIREAFNSLRDHFESVQVEGEDPKPDGYWLMEEPLGAIRLESRDDVKIMGLGDFLTAERTYTDHWTETVKPRNLPEREEHHERMQAMPEDISMRAFMKMKEFLDEERGLDLSFSETEADAGYGYGELLNDAGNPELAADGGGERRE